MSELWLLLAFKFEQLVSTDQSWHRLQAVSLFLTNLLGRMQRRTEQKCTVMSVRIWNAKLQTTSSVGIRRWVKRETVVILYSISEACDSGDKVILLVNLRSYDPHLSVSFISDMQCMPLLSLSPTPWFLWLVTFVRLLFYFYFLYWLKPFNLALKVTSKDSAHPDNDSIWTVVWS